MRPIEKYLDEVKKKREIPSENAFARTLGMKPSSLYLIRRGVNTPSEETCKKIAELAGDSYEKVLLLAQLSKAPEVSKHAWERILKYAVKGGLAMGLALLISSLLPSNDSMTTPLIASFIAPQAVDIMSNHIQRA